MDPALMGASSSEQTNTKPTMALVGLWALACVSSGLSARAWLAQRSRVGELSDATSEEQALIGWGAVRELGTGAYWLAGGALLLALLFLCGARHRSWKAALVPVLLAVAAPFVTRQFLSPQVPAFDRQLTTLDLLARPDLWDVQKQHPSQAPELRVLTPAVDQHSDSGDKPALWMPPPCEVRVVVPEGLPSGFLRLAAGIDKVVRNRLPKGVADVTVDFEVEIDGEVLYSERIINERAKPGVWQSEDWTWRHASPEALPVRGGSTIVLRTSIPYGHAGQSLPGASLLAGFGGCVVETRVPTPRATARPTAPNVILIVQDTLRADRCSTYGYNRETSPVLSALAARGTLFEQSFSTSSWTWPSTASLLTGLAPDAHGVTSNESCTLNLALTSLPEALQARGYSCAAISCNPLIVPARNFDQGFEQFDYHSSEFRKSDEAIPDALRWLDGHRDARFFLYLHLADPHTPHTPRQEDLDLFGGVRPGAFPAGGLDEFGSQYWRAYQETGRPPDLAPEMTEWVDDVYDASVRTGDFWLGELLAYLERHGLTENTVIAFTSDHGEELLDRGRIGHGHGIHAEVVHVPLVIAGPGIPAGVRISDPVSNRHLAPTLAALGGAELIGMEDGGMLLRELGPEPPAGVLFATSKGWRRGQNYQELIGLKSGALSLHWWESTEGDRLELYNDSADPGQTTDLTSSQSEQAEDMLEIAKSRREAHRDWAPAHRVGVGAAGTEMLTGIGYIDGDDEAEDE